MELSERKREVLSLIVAAYVRSGEPVGSKAIADKIGLSSATVRNEMAELITQGYLEQPYTSSGRVPTQNGYRKYIKSILEPQELPREEKLHIDSLIEPVSYEPEKLLVRIAEVLADITRLVAIASTPDGSESVVKGIQFVQTSRRTAMLILLSSSGLIRNKLFHVEFDITNEMIRMLFTTFNHEVVGKHVSDITVSFIHHLAENLGEMSVFARAPLYALLQAAQETEHSELFISGQINLLISSELERADVRRILSFLERKEELAELLKQRRGRITAFVGNESGKKELENAAFVVRRYAIDEQDCGAIAILGPMRIDYPKVFSLIKYTSQKAEDILSSLLGGG